MSNAVIGALRVTLGIDTAEFQDGVNNVQKEMKRIGGNLQAVGTKMSAAVTAPLTGLGVWTLKVAGDFEMAMNQVRAVSGATGDEFTKLRDQAKELGATTQFSSSDAAEAMGFLSMAGMKTNEILAAMPNTLQLASAAQLDMASAADIVTNILAGYNKDVSELEGAVDVLVKAFTSANTDLRQLGEAMKYAGPVASAAGVNFEEAAASLGMMGNAGIQASMAGTSLRGAISRMLSPTKAMSTAMEEAGLNFVNASGKLLPLADIIEQLEPHADNAGLFMELFGQRAGPAMAALVSQGSDSLRELTTELQNSGGTAAEISAVQMEGFNGAMRELSSAFEGLQIAIADSGFLEWAASAVNAVANWIQEVSKTSPELLKWGTIIAGAAAAIGPLVLALGLVVTAFAAISAPVLAAVAAVAAVAAGITALYYAVQTAIPYLQQLGTQLWEGIRAGAQMAVEAVTQLGQQILEVMRALPAQMLQIGMDIMNGLKEGIMNAGASVVESAKGVAASAVNGVKSLLGIHSPSRVMHEVGNNIVLGLNNGMDELRGDTQSLAGSIGSTISSAFQGVIDGSKSVGDALKDLLKQLASTWANNAFQALFGMGGGAGSGGGGGIFGGLGGLFGKLFDFARGGTIMPGGSGGIDSQLVAFRKSPNERVDITKPGQTLTRGEGGANVSVNIINKAGADVRSETRPDGSIDVIVDRMMAQKLGTRGTDTNNALRQGFGARQRLASR